MTTQAGVRFDADYHVHSTFSDGVSTLDENVQAARSRGLRLVCLADHVRSGTTWLPEFVAAVSELRGTGTQILAGVEAKILDASGHLDLPGDCTGIDLLLIADHQFPGPTGPVLPDQVRTQLRSGAISADDAVATLIEATGSALAATAGLAATPGAAVTPGATGASGPRPLLAHLFSLLPKLGLSESAVRPAALRWLANQASAAGALLEVNEKWACPSARTVRAFATAGVPVVAGSDSHDCASIGVFRAVRRIAASAAAGQPT